MKKRLGIMSVLLLMTSTAYALDCDNARSQPELNECTYLEFQAADKKLNKVYNQHRVKLSTERKEQLKKAQQAWIKYRDLDCNYETDFYKGGSVMPTIYNSCARQKTEVRIKEIESWIEGIDY